MCIVDCLRLTVQALLISLLHSLDANTWQTCFFSLLLCLNELLAVGWSYSGNGGVYIGESWLSWLHCKSIWWDCGCVVIAMVTRSCPAGYWWNNYSLPAPGLPFTRSTSATTHRTQQCLWGTHILLHRELTSKYAFLENVWNIILHTQ